MAMAREEKKKNKREKDELNVNDAKRKKERKLHGSVW